jgi:hypothetical protein
MNSKSLNVIRWRRKAKQKLIDYKGGKCQICGYSKNCPSAYDFHHRNPEEKEFGIGGHKVTLSWEKLKKEVDKCDLLCKNCHAEVHENERKNGFLIKKKSNKKCPICKKVVFGIKKFCSRECCSIDRRKVPRPKKEQLLEDLRTLSWKATGKKYGVSDNAVRKWYKNFCKN